jgi:hypothetical protein
LLDTLTESDEDCPDTGSESDQPLYSAAVESYLGLKEPTNEDFKSCEPGRSLIRPSKPRQISFEDAKADLAEIWPFTEVKTVRVKKASLTTVDRDKWPLATVKPAVAIPEEDRLLKLNMQAISPDKSPEDRLQEAENLLIQFQSAYKTRSMSVHELERQVDDQASQLKESEIWSESLGRRMMSLTARISEQESAILQLGQELGKEKEKRREEEEEAIMHKLDGLNRVYPPVTEETNRRMSTMPAINRSQSSFNNSETARGESTGYAAPRYARHSSSVSYGSVHSGQGYQRRPSFFARVFRQGSESSSNASASGTESPPQSRLSSFSSGASTFINVNQSKIAVVAAADKGIDTALDRVKALEDVKTEVGILRQKLESLELALSTLNDSPPAGTVDVVLS